MDILEISGLTGEDFHRATMYIRRVINGEKNKERLAELWEQSYRFAMAGAMLGNGACMMTLGELYFGRTVKAAAACVDPAAEGVSWWKKGAETGDGRCCTNLGLLYLHKPIPGCNGYWESGYPLDPGKALEFFMRGYELGDTKAGRHVGLCYENGWAVAQNFEMAFEWYTKAAERGDSSAKLFAADYILEGKGTRQDPEEAIRRYEALVECRGHDVTNAAYALACIYRDGVYVQKDPELAEKYFRSVLATGNEHDSDMIAKAKEALGIH